MKKVLIPLFFLNCIFVLSTHAQVAYQNKISPADYKSFEVKLKNKSIENDLIYHFIDLIDKRDDTTRLGFIKGDNYSQLYFNFPEPATRYLSKKINIQTRIYTDTLKIILNRLWVFETKLPVSVGRLLWSGKNFKIMCVSKVTAEIYKKYGDSYLLISNYDSSINTNGYMAHKVDNLLANGINEMIRTADSIGKNISKIPANTKQFSNSLNLLPAVLLAKGNKTGIYLKFSDFLKDIPVEIPFKYIVHARKKDEEIILDNSRTDDSLYTKYCWGFCKDGAIYMRIGESFSKLTKIENSYELRAIDLARYFKMNGNGLPIILTSPGFFPSPTDILLNFALSFLPADKRIASFENISPFKLDFKTGEIY